MSKEYDELWDLLVENNEELAAIKPREVENKDFAYEIYAGLLSDSFNQFYCSSLIEGLKVIAEFEQQVLSSGDYNPDDENLLGFYSINGKDVWIDDLADKLEGVKTDKKILPDTWGPGYSVIA